MKRSQLITIVVLLAAILGLLLGLAAVLKGRQALPQVTEPARTTQTETTAPVTTAPHTEPTTQPTEPTTQPTTQPTAPAISPEEVGLYIPAPDGTKARMLVAEFSAKRKEKTDIDCFEVIASREERLAGGSFVRIWQTAWDTWQDTEETKIGFSIRFSRKDAEPVTQTILKPGDAKWFYDYLEIYLYDDINQTPGVWYTHLEDSDIKEDTVISSIKLTSGSRIEEVGDIELTAFLYTDSSCFDAHGNYIGEAAYTIVIKE